MCGHSWSGDHVDANESWPSSLYWLTVMPNFVPIESTKLEIWSDLGAELNHKKHPAISTVVCDDGRIHQTEMTSFTCAFIFFFWFRRFRTPQSCYANSCWRQRINFLPILIHFNWNLCVYEIFSIHSSTSEITNCSMNWQINKIIHSNTSSRNVKENIVLFEMLHAYENVIPLSFNRNTHTESLYTYFFINIVWLFHAIALISASTMQSVFLIFLNANVQCTCIFWSIVSVCACIKSTNWNIDSRLERKCKI